MQYKSNPKHKEPWQRGRKGSLCPTWPASVASSMLEESVLCCGKRYATREGRAYCAQDDGQFWHGYPVCWMEVPEKVRREWLAKRTVSRSEMRRFWRV